ncbi:MAG TPA: carbamoyltransferase [Pirellulales bacterium]|jgi:carbamoyltransferase
MTAILGISAFYHDSAAALVVDGQIVAAAQEERFTRVKHDHRFPSQAIAYCLREARLDPGQIDYVGFYEKPLLKFDRLLETYLAHAPRGLRQFCESIPQWLKQKLWLPREIHKAIPSKYKQRPIFVEHHESHAASAFFPSPFDAAAIITVDGVGEWATATCGVGRGNRIELTHELRFPHSLGLLYSAFTYYTGFRVNSGEYKLMGLAPYGEPIYADLIREKLLDLKEDGSFRLDLSYFNYCHGLTMTSGKFHRVFGGPPRLPESHLTQRHMDLAASIQVVTEEIMLRMARHAYAATDGMADLCLAGGVALNCVANGRILREGPFRRLWIQPAAGDAGGAIGVALFVWYQLLANDRVCKPTDAQHGSLLGPRHDNDQIKAFLDSVSAEYYHCQSEQELCDMVASLIAAGNVVGWFHGRMEFGPRALGGRSILGDARSPTMQSNMNLKIKFRESFRPFAPSVLRERAQDFFETPHSDSSPYMLLVAPVLDRRRTKGGGESKPQGLAKAHVNRSEIPAVTHVDYSARFQTVEPERNGRYYKLIKSFEQQTGCPLIINTSFNVRGEPLVNTPYEAYRCFLSTDMDVLVLEDFVLLKRKQAHLDRASAQMYLSEFDLD